MAFMSPISICMALTWNPPAQPPSWPSILNLYCLWATRHWWSVAAQTRSMLPYMLQLQSFPLFVKYLIHSFKIMVYGCQHIHIHTHMRNAVSLVWGSLRGQPQTVGPVTNSWTSNLINELAKPPRPWTRVSTYLVPNSASKKASKCFGCRCSLNMRVEESNT